ncbi:MAG: hypothetical protein AB7S26_14625 [Sandaracinaceae bacterium]
MTDEHALYAILAALAVTLVTACAGSPTPLARAPAPRAVEAARWSLHGGHTVVVRGTRLTIYDGVGRRLASSPRLIRRCEEDPTCPCEGFRAIEPNADGFDVVQQICAGWMFVLERVMVRRDVDGAYVVRAVRYELIDRAAPDESRQVEWTAQAAAAPSLRDVDLDAIYGAVAP